MRNDNSDLTRRGLLTASAAGLALLVSAPASGQQPAAPQKQGLRPPPLPADQVKEFVIAAHLDLDKVKKMLSEEPKLLNATWDWSHGDFEAAIGGAGHMGRRDIAQHLLDNGARMDIFVAAMLGHLDLVKATLTAHPNLAQSKGPHGITLLKHAEAGGDDSKPVLAFLQSLPSADAGTH